MHTKETSITRWNLSIREETDRLVHVFLARSGLKKGDLSAFVEVTCRGEILRRTVTKIEEQNANLTTEEAMKFTAEPVATFPPKSPQEHGAPPSH